MINDARFLTFSRFPAFTVPAFLWLALRKKKKLLNKRFRASVK